MTADGIIDTLTRRHYGRLLAYLAAGFRDVTLAEDALQDALVSGLVTWERDGIPGNPEAWLMAAARRKILDRLRHLKVSRDFADEVKQLVSEAFIPKESPEFPDERLKLMFVCAHPAIDPASHTPLMLQTVLGLDARRIADAFVVSPAAMGQRLVRTKAKIAATRISFEIPDKDALPGRMSAVLDAIYAAYTTDWGQFDGVSRHGLTQEALYLCQLCIELSGEHAEALGLKALMLFSESRAPGRFSSDGAYIPLDQQDVVKWDMAKINEAEHLLEKAAREQSLGRYQLEAAIQSAIMNGKLRGIDTRNAVVQLYSALVQLSPVIGAYVGYAAALIRNNHAISAWALLESLPADRIRLYQPYWAVAAEALSHLGRRDEAAHAYEMAEGLSDITGVKSYLRKRREVLQSSSS